MRLDIIHDLKLVSLLLSVGALLFSPVLSNTQMDLSTIETSLKA